MLFPATRACGSHADYQYTSKNTHVKILLLRNYKGKSQSGMGKVREGVVEKKEPDDVTTSRFFLL